MKRKFLFIPLTILSMVLSGCNDTQQTPTRVMATFVNYDDTTLYVTSVPYGGDAVYQGEIPTRPSTSESHHYVFNGWDQPLIALKADTKFIAQYDSIINSYEVSFKNYDGTLLQTQIVEHGGEAIYSGERPVKPNTQQFSYSFIGWDKPTNNITKSTDFFAQFNETVNQYTVTFKNYDGTVLGYSTVDYGTKATYTGQEPQKPNDEMYHYSFTGWDISLENITLDCVATAQFSSELNQYTVTFKNYDGSFLASTTVNHGETANYTGPDPVKPATQQYTYTFCGWSASIENVTSDLEVTAQYNMTINKYTVTFRNFDDSILGKDTVDYGGTAVYSGETPTRGKTAQYTYTFTGWDSSLENITDDCDRYAVYSSTVNQYTVTFKNYDGSILGTDTVDYGDDAHFSGGMPTRARTQQYTYTFTGWDISLESIRSDCVATAQYSYVINQYTVTFKNYDGTFLYSDTVDYGGTAEYKLETNPVKPATQQYTYAFSGWDISLENIAEDVVATAQFSSSVNQYTVTFKNYDGTVLGYSTVDYGGTATYNGQTPTRATTQQYTYAFSGWDISLNNICEDCVATAQYNLTTNQYTVTFKNYDGTVLGSDTVDYGSSAEYKGSTPTKPTTEQYTYTFSGWDISLANITNDCVAVAQYDANLRYYSVFFKNYDGTLLYTDSVAYGSSAHYSGATPTKPGNQQYNYTFNGWDISLDNITSTATAIAQFNANLNQYTVTFKNYDGTVLGTDTVDYGTDATYHGETPTRPSDAQYTYTFSSWSGSLSSITEDCERIAQYITTINQYTVTFKNYDGTVLETQTVNYGSTVTYGGITPTRSSDEQYDYTFSGWDVSLGSITSDTIAIAQFNESIRAYQVTFKNYDGSVLQTINVNYGSEAIYSGATPTKPSDSDYTYTFNGWDVVLTNITKDTIAIAQFIQNAIPKCTVTFKNYDGTILETKTCNYGGSVTYTGATPTRPSDASYNYTFSGWSISLSNITEDCVATAKYNKTNRETYTLTIEYDYSLGTATGAGTYDYNTYVTLTATPNEGCSFVGWFSGNYLLSDSSSYSWKATSDATYIAKFKDDSIKDTISFGRYPKTHVSDQETIQALNNITTKNSAGYYEYQGHEYAKVTTQKNISEPLKYSDGSYLVNGHVDYFLVEPIEWKYVQISDNQYTLYTDEIIDYKPFNTYGERIVDDFYAYPNCWEFSSLREYLNGSFFNTQFTEDEKNLIIEKSLVNSDTTYHPKEYYRDTTDMFYVQTYQEWYSMGMYGYQMMKANMTDYAMSKGYSGIEYWFRGCMDSNYVNVLTIENGYANGGSTYVSSNSGLRICVNVSSISSLS